MRTAALFLAIALVGFYLASMLATHVAYAIAFAM